MKTSKDMVIKTIERNAAPSSKKSKRLIETNENSNDSTDIPAEEETILDRYILESVFNITTAKIGTPENALNVTETKVEPTKPLVDVIPEAKTIVTEDKKQEKETTLVMESHQKMEINGVLPSQEEPNEETYNSESIIKIVIATEVATPEDTLKVTDSKPINQTEDKEILTTVNEELKQQSESSMMSMSSKLLFVIKTKY